MLPPNTDVEAQSINPNIFPLLGYTVDLPGRATANRAVHVCVAGSHLTTGSLRFPNA